MLEASCAPSLRPSAAERRVGSARATGDLSHETCRLCNMPFVVSDYNDLHVCDARVCKSHRHSRERHTRPPRDGPHTAPPEASAAAAAGRAPGRAGWGPVSYQPSEQCGFLESHVSVHNVKATKLRPRHNCVRRASGRGSRSDRHDAKCISSRCRDPIG